jgi:hypothetical protein
VEAQAQFVLSAARSNVGAIERIEIAADQLAVFQPEAGFVRLDAARAPRGVNGMVRTSHRARLRLDDGDTIAEALLEHEDARQVRQGRGERDVELNGLVVFEAEARGQPCEQETR